MITLVNYQHGNRATIVFGYNTFTNKAFDTVCLIQTNRKLFRNFNSKILPL